MKSKKNVKTSLRKRWVIECFSGVVLLFVILGIIAVNLLYAYYYNGTEKYLTEKLNDVKTVFTKFAVADNVELNSNPRNIAENFAYKDETELLIFDKNGKVAFSSSGENSQTGNISSAKGLKPGSFSVSKGKINGVAVMSVSTSVEDISADYSVLTVVSSIEKINTNFSKAIWLVIIISVVVLACIFVLMFLFVKSVTNDILKIKSSSEEFLNNVRCDKKIQKEHNDEIGDLAMTVNKLANAVKANNNSQFEFLTTVSHELRTPLSIIDGNVDYTLNIIPASVAFGIGEGKAAITLQEQEILRERLKIVKSTIKILVDMIDMITDFAKSNIDRFDFKMTRIDVIAELTDAVLGLQDKAKSNNVILMDIFSEAMEHEATAISPFIKGDSNALKRVFINIIDNAIKYSEPNKGVVKINVVMDNSDVQIVITDNGCGIPREDLPKIKTRFFRAKNATKVRGTGIGLSISEEIIRAFHGFLDITSDGVGKGTTVIIAFPRGD